MAKEGKGSTILAPKQRLQYEKQKKNGKGEEKKKLEEKQK